MPPRLSTAAFVDDRGVKGRQELVPSTDSPTDRGVYRGEAVHLTALMRRTAERRACQ
jgi:hypothetical protein